MDFTGESSIVSSIGGAMLAPVRTSVRLVAMPLEAAVDAVGAVGLAVSTMSSTTTPIAPSFPFVPNHGFTAKGNKAPSVSSSVLLAPTWAAKDVSLGLGPGRPWAGSQ